MIPRTAMRSIVPLWGAGVRSLIIGLGLTAVTVLARLTLHLPRGFYYDA